jgi:hypothetical protein
MIGSGIKKYIDHSIYTSKFAFVSEWGGIFYYYSDIKRKRNLNDNEYLLLKDHFRLLFDVWKSFYTELIENPSSSAIIIKNIGDFDVKNALDILIKEEKSFSDNTIKYIDNFLVQGKNHLLNSLDGIDIDATISRPRLSQLYDEKRKFFSDLSINNIKANWWRNRPQLSRVLYSIKEYFDTKDDNSVLFIKNYYHLLNTTKKMKEYSFLPNWQYLPSAHKVFDEAANCLKRRDSERPFYMSLHVLDPHSYINFFSYDLLDNKSVIDEEFEMLDSFVNELGTDFIGDLPYLLSLRYTDYCLERLCHSLKQNGLWDNTILLAFADHGSSFSYFPLHNKAVNCFDDECYHVPMWLRIPNSKGVEIKTFHNAIDMFPTVYDILGFNRIDGIKGVSMLDKSVKSKEYVMTEYMGPGCPDLLSRRIWFSIRDEHYLIGYKVGIWEKFDDGDLCEVYDLHKDKRAYYNINRKINKEKISYLLTHIQNRFDEVKHDVNLYMGSLKCNYDLHFD